MRINLIFEKRQFGLQGGGFQFINTQVVTQPMGKQWYGRRTCRDEPNGKYAWKSIDESRKSAGVFSGQNHFKKQALSNWNENYDYQIRQDSRPFR